MMNRTSLPTLILVGLLVPIALPGCPASANLCDNGACEAAARDDGGTPDGDAAVVPVDECLDKPDAPECLDEAAALFVSADGDATAADGTKAKPFKTLGAALGRITADRKRIYVCDGTYPEAVVLDTKHAGVSLFGGFTCEWLTSTTKPTLGDGPLALKVTGATGVAIAGLAFAAHDATDPGGSSIAAFVANADVTFKGVSLAAGLGKAGDPGVLVPFTYPAASELKGKDGADGGAAMPYTCPGDATTSSVGGAGGPNNGGAGQAGTVGPNNAGTLSQCEASTGGGPGQAGTSPAAATAAASRGSLGADGWEPATGPDGAKGGAGQGGGGGAGLGGGYGGGGGAGGCGGKGGPGGKGGGASIALAMLQATVRLEASSLTATNAGDGGNGAAGQTGQTPGGARGLADGAGTGCNGGNGGPGGTGAEGAGGPGGISVGVLHLGSPPDVDDATTAAITVGNRGAPGTGGKPGAAPAGNDGPAGVAEPIKNASQL